MQLSTLTQLHSVSIWSSWPADAYNFLTSLPLLRCLHLNSVAHMPACLSELTGLEELYCINSAQLDGAQQASATLNAALLQLTRLTSLHLDNTPHHCGLPPAAANLGSLQRCFFDAADASAEPEPLPVGPWCGSLRLLGAPATSLLCSTEFMAAASCLEHLCLNSLSSASAAPPATVLARLYALRRLEMDTSGQEHVPVHILRMAISLAQVAPNLDMFETTLLDNNSFQRLFDWPE